MHSVRTGQSVASIASRYAVTPEQLARWNNLKRGKALVAKQQLVVFVPVVEKPASSNKTMVAANRLMVPDKLPLYGVKAVPVVAKATPAKAVEKPVAIAEPDSAEPIVATTATPAPKQHSAKAVAVQETDTSTSFVASVEAPQDSLPTEYVVRKGDFLEKLARTHGVSVAQLMAWNELKTITLTPGQKLVLYAPADAEAIAQNAPQPAEEPAPRVAAAKPSPKMPPSPRAISKVHLVQPGDTLYNISRRYEGVTVDQLRKLNNLQSDAVKPGQQLIVSR
jgi:membrane-bound lytic murein transglycosylase D